MSEPSNLSRRQFFKKTAAATIGASVFPAIIPSSAFGATAPGNRLTMGCIGLGSQGTGNMRNFLGRRDIHIVAVSDVDREHRLRAKGIIDSKYGNNDCTPYNDFREMLERDDLDVISIAVPDHWHAIPAIACAKKKLDIYAEKPLALTIKEGRAMCHAVHKNGIVWQTGSWQRSKDNFRFACELVRNGRIGNVHTVKVGLPSGRPIEPQPEMPVPDGFDYNFWLGPAPWSPYTQERCHWNFRWILDYSGGQLTDWGAHHCDIAQWGMDTEYTGPFEVYGKGDYPREGLWDAATSYHFYCTYPVGVSPVAPKGFVMDVGDGKYNRGGVKWEGEDGWVWVDRGGIDAHPKDLLRSKIGANEIRLYDSRDHAQNWIDCIKSRSLTITPIEVAQRSISIAHLGNIAMRLGRKIKWDPQREVILNDDEANRMLIRTMRAPWHI